jgi:hypothetical protein
MQRLHQQHELKDNPLVGAATHISHYEHQQAFKRWVIGGERQTPYIYRYCYAIIPTVCPKEIHQRP